MDEARAAIRRFRTNRALFINDSTALEGAERSLNDAAEKVRRLLARYRFMEGLVKECRGMQPIGKTFKGGAVEQNWAHGAVLPHARDSEDEDSMTDGSQGTVVFRGKIEGQIRNTLCRRKCVQFECRERQPERRNQDRSTDSTRGLETQDPLILIQIRPSYYIVGWTLSIRTGRQGSKSFSVKNGGILESNLMIDIKAPTCHRADWHCRIYFVNRADYNFLHLISK